MDNDTSPYVSIMYVYIYICDYVVVYGFRGTQFTQFKWCNFCLHHLIGACLCDGNEGSQTITMNSVETQTIIVGNGILVRGWVYPSEKYVFVSWGCDSQLNGKKKHVPNHQNLIWMIHVQFYGSRSPKWRSFGSHLPVVSSCPIIYLFRQPHQPPNIVPCLINLQYLVLKTPAILVKPC